MPTAVIDSNPLTPSLAIYKALRARYVDFMLDDELNATQFDVLANEILDASRHVVVLDTGSSSFFPVMGYLKSKSVLEAFSETGRHVVVHSVLVGGAGARETLGGLVVTVENLPADGYVAWLNSFFGPVLFDGKRFEETKAFRRIRDRLIGIVDIRQRSGISHTLHLNALRQMTSRHLTFKEAMATAEFWLVDRQRLAGARREIYEQLFAIFGCEKPVTAPISEN